MSWNYAPYLLRLTPKGTDLTVSTPAFQIFMIDKISGEEMYMRTYDVAENRWQERGVWTKCPNILRLKDACKALLTVCLS